MVRIIRNPEINLIGVVATDANGHEHTIQHTSDSPFSSLPGPSSSPQVTRIYDLSGGFNLRRDGALSAIRSYQNSYPPVNTTTRLRETAPELLKAFTEAGFPAPAVVVPLGVRMARAFTRFWEMKTPAL